MLLTWGNTNANAFNPLNTPANLTALYLPGVGQTNASGNCSAWADQSGNGNNLAQVTATNQPLINADGSLTFDGVDNYMKTAGFTLAQPTVVTILYSQISWTSGKYVFDGFTQNSGVLFQSPSTPSVKLFAGSLGPETAGPAIGAVGVTQVIFSGAASSVRLNNGSAVTGDAGSVSMGGFTLGVDGLVTPTFSNIKVYGASIRSANDSTINANDRLFWMRMGGLS